VLTGATPAEGVTPVISAEPIFPLKSPTLISMPLGFLGCFLGTLLGGRKHSTEQEEREGLQTSYDEIFVRANTGITNVEKELRDATPTQEPRHT
jgi:cation/acetate symporter